MGYRSKQVMVWRVRRRVAFTTVGVGVPPVCGAGHDPTLESLVQHYNKAKSMNTTDKTRGTRRHPQLGGAGRKASRYVPILIAVCLPLAAFAASGWGKKCVAPNPQEDMSQCPTACSVTWWNPKAPGSCQPGGSPYLYCWDNLLIDSTPSVAIGSCTPSGCMPGTFHYLDERAISTCAVTP